MNNLILKVIKNAGTQKELAKIIGVRQATISKWRTGKGINAKYLCAISDASNGEVTVEQLAQALDYRKKNKQGD